MNHVELKYCHRARALEGLTLCRIDWQTKTSAREIGEIEFEMERESLVYCTSNAAVVWMPAVNVVIAVES